MKSNPKVMLLLPTPPPYGGGEIQNLLMLDKFQNNPNFLIYQYSRKNTRQNQGEISFSNILFGLRWIIKSCTLILCKRPKSVYLGLPKNFGPFLRTSIVILVSRLFKVKVFGELAGADFLFLDSLESLPLTRHPSVFVSLQQTVFAKPRLPLEDLYTDLDCA